MAGSLLYWAQDFVGDQLRTRLAAQQTYFPAKDSKAFASPECSLTRSLRDEMVARLGAGPVDGDLAAFVVTARKPS